MVPGQAYLACRTHSRHLANSSIQAKQGLQVTHRGEAAAEISTGFQPAVSPTSSRQPLDVTAAFELFPRLRIRKTRFSRLEALRYDSLTSPQNSSQPGSNLAL
jgi:hypothetical protein